jgi:TIR domain
MATLRQYFETDFSHVLRVHVGVPLPNTDQIEGVWLVDFLGFASFLSCYVPGQRSVEFFLDLLRAVEYGKTIFPFQHKITLPSTRQFPGSLKIENKDPLLIQAQFFGDPDYVSANEVHMSRRIFIYSETQLSNPDLGKLKEQGKTLGHEVQFRSEMYVAMRSRQEAPLAFISYDSRDREVAQKIAIGLQRLMCPVWYDEFSLKVGDNLRDSIEKGLRECRKCVLVLSPNFFSNKGWTKKEFDSVFTREILEEKQLVLPVWCNVAKQEVFDYSPSLLNVKGLNWKELGEDEACRRLFLAVEPPE